VAPTSQTLIKRFGGWSEALESIELSACGVPAPAALPVEPGARVTTPAPVEREVPLDERWRPLIITLIGLINGQRPGGVGEMNTHPGTNEPGAQHSPSVRVAVTPPPLSVVHVSISPGPGATSTEFTEFTDEFQSPWNAATIATTIVQRLVSSHGLTLDHLVTFGKHAASIRAFDTLHSLGDDMFSLHEVEQKTNRADFALQEDDLLESTFDAAVEILARLVEAGLIDSPGHPVFNDNPNGPIARQGVSYQHSGYSDNDIVGWTIDVTSWRTPADLDWVGHLAELDGPPAISLFIGSNWALTVQPGQRDSEVPAGLAEQIRSVIPGAIQLWSRGQDAEWFDRRFRSAAEIIDVLKAHEFRVQRTSLPDDADPYIVESLADDTYAPVIVRAGDAPPAHVSILLEENLAEQAAHTLERYLPEEGGEIAIAGDGWMLRVASSEHPDCDVEAYAEVLAEALDATYSSVELDAIPEPEPTVTPDSWDPQSHQIKQLITYVSLHTSPSPDWSWGDEIAAASDRAVAALTAAGRNHQLEQVVDLCRRVSRNSFFWKAGSIALCGLMARDLLVTEDYDLLTAGWRAAIGAVHPDDP
jgi:hypothetical protein